MKVKEFNLPEGVSLSEKDQAGLSALATWMTDNFNELAKGMTNKDDLIKSMTEKLEEAGFSGDKLKSLQDSIHKQGDVLTALKERANNTGINIGGLKAAFDAQFEKLNQAIKEEKSGFTIKAIDEHNPTFIQTTSNSITAANGAIVQESITNDPNLYLKRRDRQYIHDIANVSYVSEVPEVFTFMEEGSEQGYIALVSENGLKPQVHLTLTKNQVEAQKAAGYIVVTEEMMKWRPRAWAAIQRLFRDKVYRDYENILTTDMLANASSYISSPLDGSVANPSDFDAIIATITQLELLNYEPDVLVINPADKWRLAMTTTENGMFILPYIQQGGQFSLLGLRVITTTKMPAGKFLIGESNTWYIEEEAPKLRTGLVNDDLIHNRMTIVGEIFFLSYVPSNNAGSFVEGSFADIKAALKTTAA